MEKAYEAYRNMKDVEGALRRCHEDMEVSPENKAVIDSFAKQRLAKGIGRLRVAKCVYCLRFMAKWLVKPYDKATKEDLISMVGGLENKPYSENTRHDFKVVLKMFYKWLKGNDESFPPEIIANHISI